MGDSNKQLADLPKDVSIIDLGSHFKNFSDTANVISGLDLVITTDNVILNLAGALGKKTFGLFNTYPNFRWFSLDGDDVVWYKSVKPFQCRKENDWDSIMEEVKQAVIDIGEKNG